jgi:hypothetical protein
MNRVMREDAFFLVIVVATSIQIAVEPRKIAARYFEAQAWTDAGATRVMYLSYFDNISSAGWLALGSTASFG